MFARDDWRRSKVDNLVEHLNTQGRHVWAGLFTSRVLVPASLWLESGVPLAPEVKVMPPLGSHGPLRVTLDVAAHSKAVRFWAVRLRYGSH